LPDLALVKVSRTTTALFPVRCKSLTTSVPKLRLAPNDATNA